jgi:hypothetical protein
MEVDFAIVYWGLTRSTKAVYTSHIELIQNILKKNSKTFKIFMHTWKTKDNKQSIWETIIDQPIDYDEYKLLRPDVYQIDNQETFLESVNMNKFFYKHVPKYKEWAPGLVKNHVCALESMKRGFLLVEKYMSYGVSFKNIMFVRPDVMICNEFPLHQIVSDKINIPNFDHYGGYNDRFAVMNYKNALVYAKRIDELAAFRKNHGRIVSEHYTKFIIDKYRIPVNMIGFDFIIVRPVGVQLHFPLSPPLPLSSPPSHNFIYRKLKR